MVLQVASAEISDVVSAVVSYQYKDSITNASDRANITSPVISYQFVEWPTSLTAQAWSSLPASYYFGSAAGPVVIHTPPLSQFVHMSDTATFSVGADGQPPLTYQWLFNGSTPVGGSAPNLSLDNVQLTNAGDYYVIVANGYGAVTSLTAQLIFMVPTNRAPTVAEIGTGTIPTNSHLMVFTNGVFTTNAVVFPDRMTIILTHGWTDSPNGWASQMASIMQQRLGTNTQNIVAWDWHIDADTTFPMTAGHRTREQGLALGNALLTSLGGDYAMPIHFLGHSLGTLVNAAAADFLHGDIPSSLPVKSAGAFDPENTQMTLFDNAEIPANLPGNLSQWMEQNSYFYNVLLARALDLPEPTPPFYFKPLPTHAAWSDNYISAVGLIPHTNAVNIILTNRTNGAEAFDSAPDWTSWYAAAKLFHRYPCDWYHISVSNPSNSLMGHRWSFERGGIGMAPPINSYFFQSISNSPLDLKTIKEDQARAYLLGQLGKTLVNVARAVGGSAEDTAETYTIDGPVSYVGTVGGLIRYSYERDAYLVNVAYETTRDAFFTLTTRIGDIFSPPSRGQITTPNEASGEGSGSNAPVCLWVPIVVPSNALSMTFDFELFGDGAGDRFAAAINGSNVLSLGISLLETNTPLNSGLFDVSQYAGQPLELFFGIIGGTSTNATVTVNAIRFYTLVPPTLKSDVSGKHYIISWPISELGYTLETTTNLAMPESWMVVTNTPAIVNLRNTVTNEITGPARYFRLRSP